MTFSGTSNAGVFGIASFAGLGATCTIAPLPQPGVRPIVQDDFINILGVSALTNFKASSFGDSLSVGWNPLVGYLLSLSANPALPLPEVLVLPTSVTGTDDVNGNMIIMRMSPAFLGGRTVDVSSPDFTGLTGWLDQFGPRGTATFEIRGESDSRASACAVGRSAKSSRYGII